MSDVKPLVLIADDTETDREAVARYIPLEFDCQFAEDIEQARRVLSENHVYVAIVDLYLDEGDSVPYGIQLLQEFPHVPIILISGQNPGKIEEALRHYDDRRLRLLNKDSDFGSRDVVAKSIRYHTQKHYNEEIRFEFKNNAYSWDAIANKLLSGTLNLLDRERLGLEIKDLAQKAFYGWDESDSPFIRATRIVIETILDSGAHSAVMRMRPFSAKNEAQADVIFKIARAGADTARNDHGQFDAYKNITGGFGLRERRYARTCHFHGQVYAVPYYRFDETQTYADFFCSADNDEDCAEKIHGVTDNLFNYAMRHLNRRAPTSRDELVLSRYYAERIKAAKRRDLILRDLTRENAPMSVRVEGDDLIIRINGQSRRLRNPLKPVLVDRSYRNVDQTVATGVRHGDLHSANVLVDASRMSCWYIDYEAFGDKHFILVDHAELEADILFSLMKATDSFEFLARLIDAFTPLNSLREVTDISATTNNKSEKIEAQKVFQAIRAIHNSAEEVNGADAPRAYYHALMYEALRVAGKDDVEDSARRWYALIAAAQLFEKIELN